MRIVHEPERKRFAAYEDAENPGEAGNIEEAGSAGDTGTETFMGELRYSPHPGVLSATHTVVRKEHQGKGVATALLRAMAEHARAGRLHIIPACAFVAEAFRKYPKEYADVAAEKH